jgi:hypothetical protein
MDQKTAHGWIQAYMFLFFLSALCMLLLSLPLRSISSWLFVGSFLLPGSFLFFGPISIVVTGVIGILVAVGLFWRKHWARYGAALLSTLLIVDLFFLLGLEILPFDSGSILNDAFVVLKLFFSVFGIYLFAFNKDVKVLFAGRS